MKTILWAFALFIIWELLTFPFTVVSSTAGLCLSLLIGWIVTKNTSLKISFSFRAVLRLCYFFLIYLKEMIIANISIALIVLNPTLPIRPALVQAETKLKNDFLKTLLANTITMTPGTLTVQIEGEAMTIHCVRPVSSEDVLQPFEKILLDVERDFS